MMGTIPIHWWRPAVWLDWRCLCKLWNESDDRTAGRQFFVFGHSFGIFSFPAADDERESRNYYLQHIQACHASSCSMTAMICDMAEDGRVVVGTT